jgi:hypothetical protein
VFHLNSDGTEKNAVPSEFHGSGPPDGGGATSAAVGYFHGDLRPVFGMIDGDVILLNQDSGKVVAEIPDNQRHESVIGVTPVTSSDSEPTNQDLAVDDLYDQHAQVLRLVNDKLEQVPIGAGGATWGTNAQLEDWFPGYAAGRLRVVNGTAGAVTVAMQSKPDPGRGCWLNASVTGPPAVPAFPSADASYTSVAAGATSQDFFAGALTAGKTGDCASAQPQSSGERAAYVIIIPAGDPADEHIVKLTAAADGTLRIAGQVGGALTATVARGSGPGGSWGQWTLTIKGPAAPTAATAPALAGFRLTSAPGPGWTPPGQSPPDDPCRPVYRFDVTRASWKGAGVPGQVTAQIPAMTAQGSTDDGKNWQPLGELMPVSAPTRSADTVTLGPASFFYQDPPGNVTARGAQCPAAGKPLTDVRVASGGLYSNVVHLASLTPPDINGGTGAVPITGITATPATGQNATPLANGVDQATVDLALTSDGGGAISNNDPRYELVYYRDTDTGKLVTGLYDRQPGHFADYAAVGPVKGQYSDTGAAEKVHNYLTTTSTGTQSLVADINDTGTAQPNTSHSLTAKGTPVSQLDTAGAAAVGIQVTGCPGLCPLAAPADNAPALYQAGGPDGPVTGVQFKLEAVTGVASLPLAVGGQDAHTLASAPLEIPPPGNKAVLRQTSGFSGTIDTSLVTSGELVPALSVTVGGS